MKTKILTFLSLFLFLSFNIQGVKASTNLSNEQVNQLENLGFTEEEITYMSDEELEKNLKIDGELVSKVTQYFKVIESIPSNKLNSNMYGVNSENVSKVEEVSEEVYWKEVNAVLNNDLDLNAKAGNVNPDVSQTSYKTITTTISTITSKKTYRVKNSITWHIMPANRKIDVIGTAINSAFWAPDPGTQGGQQAWTKGYNCNKSDTTHSTTYSTSSAGWKKDSSGYALLIDLPDSVSSSYPCNVEKVKKMSAFSYYNASKIGVASRIDAYGKYYHQERTIAISPSITFYPASFGVSASQSKDFTPTETHALFNF
ncbi:hypothetical protein HMPREF9372_3759 [Sporosarcina newyorkensis 2681]|uniref:Uncharacterized protein n=1 Tax=Sporosarcina newyorkensis 2681 TaxID=1027292 RepID=F9DY78_9BACL|nr:hypothetical protein [Sporosarcina newyorkensis]EGQ19128.1 hypothetical protein HMPREF9372_3759 [Sporosarcina newyorkensis 2681]